MLFKTKNYFILLFICCFFQIETHAQLGFCSGNSGDPIFTEDFGTAPSSNTQHTDLPISQTDYTFLGFNPGPNDFGDGKYTVTNLNYQQWNWFNMEDHTIGDTNGKMLIVNADFVADKFYQIPITGLCENTTYEFSSWLLNLTPRDLMNAGRTPNPCNVRFEIWDEFDASRLEFGDTGDFFGSLSTEDGEWRPYALVFKTLPGQTSVILKMRNNGPGGYGNDLAVDDIVFKSCGDNIAVEDTVNQNTVSLCSSQTYSGEITAIPDGSVFGSRLFYQWQESIDGVAWVDIGGETNTSLILTNISPPAYFRAKVVEDISSINNPLCNTFSDIFNVTLAPDPLPPVSNGDVSFDCTTNQAPLSVTVPTGINVNWYDAASGGNLLLANSTTYTAAAIGAYYAESEDNTSGCVSASRVVVGVTGSSVAPPISDGDIDFNCTANQAELSVTVPTGTAVNWYDAAIGGILLQSNNINYTTSSEGDFYAEAQDEITGCTSATRTMVSTSIVNPVAPVSNGDVDSSCISSPATISVTVPTGITANWYNTSIGGTALLTGSTSFAPSVSGTYYAESEVVNTGCKSITRTSIIVDFIESPEVEDESFSLCPSSNIELHANVINEGSINAEYLWNTGAITESITTDTAGNYTVEVTNGGFCAETKTINLTQINNPVIETVKSDGSNIIITTLNSGDFLYSLDGSIFQSSNVFYDVEGGLYIVYVKSEACSEIVSEEYLHFFIPKFFTPNNDGHNDTFNLSGIEYYDTSYVSIFDRYGKLLKNARNTPFSWDGTFNGEPLSSSDYWYVIIINNQKFTGHVALKR